MHLVIFEGSRWSSFAPLSLNRPVFTLLSGMSTLLEKQIRHIKPSRLTLWVRPSLVDYCRKFVVPTLGIPTEINVPLNDEPALISSGRALHLSRFVPPTEPSAIVDEGDVIRKAWVKSPGLSPEDCINRTPAWLRLLNLPAAADQARLIEYVWDLIHWNEEAIVSDAISLRDKAHPLPSGPFHTVLEQDIFVSSGVKLSPGVVLDASRGPVVIESNASIGANSVLQGPCFIGSHTTVSPLSHIHAGASVGPQCKVGGEIATSIILGSSNKVHEGFFGHSYVGEWVNIGSGTTTSNLKNTYGPVKVRIGSKEIMTNRRFLGALIGDHAKTGVGSRLMSGCYIGYGSMVSAAVVPSFIPSFSFWTEQGQEAYRLDKLREVMFQVYSRRGRPWTQTDETLLQYVHETAQSVEK